MLTLIPQSSLSKVFSDQAPTAKSINRVSLLKNERASLQLAFMSDVDCKVSVEVQCGFKDMLEVYLVEELYSSMPIAKGQEGYLLRKDAGKYPELLRGLEGSISAESGKWYSIWLSTAPSPTLPAGENKVQIKLSAGEESAGAELVFDVIDAALPKQELIYTNWFHCDCLSTYYDAEVFSDRFWEIVETYLKTAVDYGMNMALTPIFTPPLDTKKGKERLTVQIIGVKMENGKYSFDFSNLDRWIDMCHKVGIEYFEMAHLFTQWGAKRCPKVIVEVEGEAQKMFGWKTRATSKKYKAFLSELAPKLKEYLKEKGIADKVYFHVSDEPFAGVIRNYSKASAIVKELFGEFTIIDALSNYKFFQDGLVQLPIPANDHIKPFIGNVKELWTYYCSAQTKDVSNRFFSMPSQRNRVLGCQLYKYDVKGFLHWGYNFYFTQYSRKPADPYRMTHSDYAFPSGDAYLVYPGEDGEPLTSIRAEVQNEALADIRILNTLEKWKGRGEAEKIIYGEETEPFTFKKYPHSAEYLLSLREKLFDALENG